jgi:hypothetical protein
MKQYCKIVGWQRNFRSTHWNSLAPFQLEDLNAAKGLGRRGKIQKFKKGTWRRIYCFTLVGPLWRVFDVVQEEFRKLYWHRRFGSGGRKAEALLLCWSWQTHRQTIN